MKYKSLCWGTLILLLGWYVSSWTYCSVLIPWPHLVLGQTVSLFTERQMSIHILVSLRRLFIGTILAIVLALPLGLAIGYSKSLDRGLWPLIYILYPLPKIALLPIFMLLSGLGNTSKVALLTVVLFFQILIVTRDACQKIEKERHYTLQALGANKQDIFYHLLLPHALPALFTSLRIGVGTMLTVLFFAENYGTRWGIGYFTINSWMRINYVDMYAGILVLSIIGLGLLELIDFIENKVCPWLKYQ